MKTILVKARTSDFEKFGYHTMLECGDVERATKICALHIQAYEDELQPELRRRESEIHEAQNRAGALHSILYDRPVPANDAKMLSHALKIRILSVLATLAAIACFVGNMTTFYLLGLGFLLTVLSAAGMTSLPLVVGHLVYEWIVSASRWMQIAVILFTLALTSGGAVLVGQARRDMVDRKASTATVGPYVDDGDAQNSQATPERAPEENTESRIHQTLGEGMFLIMLAAEIAFGFLVGFIVSMYTDEDDASWRALEALGKTVIDLKERVSELLLLPETAKKRCLAGILRAQNHRTRRHPPYHRALTMLLVIVLWFALPSRAQTIDHYEGILIDTSGSISRGGRTPELFHDYLLGTRKLLLTEPPNSRVWVSSISTNSFGGAHEILKGWTPEVHGVFSDDLIRGRTQLASNFARKSSGLAPVASGTDIFGGLWYLKSLFESGPKPNSPPSVSKTIWIFSDMMNETKDFPMPELIELGSQRMLERARAHGLVVPLTGYGVHVCGASVAGLTPSEWIAIKNFWTLYFSLAGAELFSYSSECDVAR